MLGRLFMQFLKYHIFRDFRKSSEAHAKIIVCILFDLKMVNLELDQSILRPKISYDCCSLPVSMRKFEINLTVFVKDFF